MASTFTTTYTVGSTSAGAIVGSNETPFSAVQLFYDGVAGSTLTTGDLTGVSEPGDLGGAAEFAIEFWFKFDAAPGGAVFITQGPVSTSGAFRQWYFSLNTTGTLQLQVLDAGLTYRGGTSLALQAGVWHHIVGTARSGTLYLYIDNAVAASDAGWGANTVVGIGATVNQRDMRLTGPSSGTSFLNFTWDELAVYSGALSAARIAAHYNAGVAMGFPSSQAISERLDAVLDVVSHHAPRSFQTGVHQVIQRYMTGQSPLEECRRALEAEEVDCAFFVTADGTLKFLASDHRSNSPYNTSQLTVGDAGGAEIPYIDLKFDYSPTFLINEWNVTRTTRGSSTPVTQTASDATSISRYFKRSQSITDVPVSTDGTALQIANALLAKYKDPMFRVTSITFDLLDPSVCEAVFRRELMDKITVKFTPPGGGSRISQDVFIQKIDISADNSGATGKATWGVSPL